MIGEPLHPLATGVIVYLTTPAEVPVLFSVWAMVLPQAAAQLLNPEIVPPVGEVWMAAVQVNAVPATLPVNAMEVAFPEQIV